MGFVAELKRRNVFRVGVAYAVSAWLVLQVADLVVEHIEAPGWVMDLLFLLVAIGFFVALAVAWAYEVTPEGIKRDEDVARDPAATHQTARKLDIITLVAVGALLALMAWNQRDAGDAPGTSDPPMAVSPATSASGAGEDGTVAAAEVAASAAGSARPAAAELADLARGIAVLPFESLSADPDDAYFAGGIHEDVLTQLAGIGDLRVISRTSMESIAQRDLTIPDLARQLGVSHVLEGSVRRAGDRVRVTVQLIDAADDAHVWAENYDRQLDDIFAIQTEIAMTIAAQLETTLSPAEEERLASVPTTSLEAYDLYLRATEAARNGAGTGVTRHAQHADLLEQAVALDPDFLAALVRLADAYARQVFFRVGPEERYRQRAERLVARIETGWPGSPEARLARANYQYAVERDFDRALAGYLALEPDFPNNPEILQNIAASYKRLGRFDEGLVYLEKALLIDPERPPLYSERAIQQAGAKRWSEILPGLLAAAQRFPDHPLIESWIGHYGLMLHGDLAGYLEMLLDPRGQVVNLRYSIEGLAEGSLIRLAAAQVGTDAMLAQLEALRNADDRWMDLLIDGHAAELLLIDGRPDASLLRARSALQAGRAQIAEAGSVPGNEPVDRYAQLAYVACLAGDPGAAEEFMSLAEATKSRNPGFSSTHRIALVMARAACGDPEAAWEALPDAQAPWLNFTDQSLILDPAFRHYFGNLPGYRALVAGELSVVGPSL